MIVQFIDYLSKYKRRCFVIVTDKGACLPRGLEREWA